MSEALFTARAPSNIALIKYMGKDDSELNLPANGSLSLTLSRLCSVAQIRRLECAGQEPKSKWVAEAPIDARVELSLESPLLGDAGVGRILRHVERVRKACGEIFAGYEIELAAPADFELRAANTFPPSAGIASSASSFSAVTLATAHACAKNSARFCEVFDESLEFKRELASLSRQGSGSSCRSFEGPWVLWEETQAAGLLTGARSQSSDLSLDLSLKTMPAMSDFVLIVSAQPKAVGSSEAHRRVKASPLWDGRAERAQERLRDIAAAIGEANLPMIARIAWSEAWEMHSLFHTSAEPFTYWEPATLDALSFFAPFVTGSEATRAGLSTPIVTLDAGPNVHVLVPTREAPQWREMISKRFPNWALLEDEQGAGAAILKGPGHLGLQQGTLRGMK